jgi:hypothetical protein
MGEAIDVLKERIEGKEPNRRVSEHFKSKRNICGLGPRERIVRLTWQDPLT